MTISELKSFIKNFDQEDLFELDQFEIQSLKNFMIGTIINDERLNRIEERRINERKLLSILTVYDEIYSKEFEKNKFHKTR